MTARKIRVVLVDDHKLVAEGLARLIESEFDLVAKAENGLQAIEACRQFRPDAVLMDISMPEMNGIDAARRILEADPSIKVIFITMHASSAYVREALNVGASGYILKRSAISEIGVAVRSAMRGRVYVTPLIADSPDLSAEMVGEKLTPRQMQVLHLVASGESAKGIAHKLGVSIKTAEFHKQTLMRKIGVHTSVELTKFAIENGLI